MLQCYDVNVYDTTTDSSIIQLCTAVWSSFHRAAQSIYVYDAKQLNGFYRCRANANVLCDGTYTYLRVCKACKRCIYTSFTKLSIFLVRFQRKMWNAAFRDESYHTSLLYSTLHAVYTSFDRRVFFFSSQYQLNNINWWPSWLFAIKTSHQPTTNCSPSTKSKTKRSKSRLVVRLRNMILCRFWLLIRYFNIEIRVESLFKVELIFPLYFLSFFIVAAIFAIGYAPRMCSLFSTIFSNIWVATETYFFRLFRDYLEISFHYHTFEMIKSKLRPAQLERCVVKPWCSFDHDQYCQNLIDCIPNSQAIRNSSSLAVFEYKDIL